MIFVFLCGSIQALKTQTVEYLVKLLEERIEGVENQAATKAQVVKALKAMQRSLKYGEEVGIICTLCVLHCLLGQ